MNIFKWLIDKAGKVPITLAQAAGLTAVVGAAGFAAMSYLNAPVDNTTTFMPPSQGEEVVFVSQNAGGGGYESNGEVGSAFKAAPSRAIQLANQQALREQQAQALEEASSQTMYGAAPEERTDLALSKAADLGGADFNLGLGGNKDITGTFEALTAAQNQLKGFNEQMQAQINAAAAQGGPNAGSGTAPAAAPGVLGSAARNWGNGGNGSSAGAGSSNAFVIQNSNKNTRGGVAAPGAEVGDAIAQAQAAMNQMQEGTRFNSGRANFGKFDGNLGDSRDATIGSSGRINKMGNELKTIRKHSADLAKRQHNAPNAGAAPFMASTRLSGGLTVNGDTLTVGQGASSVDLNRADKSIRGIKAGLKGVGQLMEERDLARSELLNWMWTVYPAALAAIFGIALLVKMARSAVVAWPFWVAAGAMTAGLLLLVWWGLGSKIHMYEKLCGGSDDLAKLAWWLNAGLTAGAGIGWLYGLLGKPASSIKFTEKFLEYGAAAVGAAGLGYGGATRMWFDKDQYLKEVEAADKAGQEQASQVQQSTGEETGEDTGEKGGNK